MDENLKELGEFFQRPVTQRAVKPLKQGVELAIKIDNRGPFTLTKTESGLVALSSPPVKPDMTFTCSSETIHKLSQVQTEDIGEIGIEICKLMLAMDPVVALRAKVHINAWDLFTHGYLGVLPLGGPALMKFLGTKGFGNIGKIKEAISKLRQNHGN